MMTPADISRLYQQTEAAMAMDNRQSALTLGPPRQRLEVTPAEASMVRHALRVQAAHARARAVTLDAEGYREAAIVQRDRAATLAGIADRLI